MEGRHGWMRFVMTLNLWCGFDMSCKFCTESSPPYKYPLVCDESFKPNSFFTTLNKREGKKGQKVERVCQIIHISDNTGPRHAPGWLLDYHVTDHGRQVIPINNCPWCGRDLDSSLQ